MTTATIAIIVPIAVLILTILVHLVTSIWWAARLTTRVETIEKWINGNSDLHNEVIQMRAQMMALAASISDIKSNVGKIFDKLDDKADK